ncbi:MAG TPA: hypothetical protein VNR70_03540 [Steroidobacteraceae bacterium]|jgi:hypothetical protein|nr:hypothetical protein [Steroidobacteraceae bacterium]
MDITDTGIALTCASTTPPAGVSATAGAAGSCGGASFRAVLGFGLVFGFDFVSAGTQSGMTELEPLGCEFSLPVSGGLGSEGGGGGAEFSVETGGGGSGAG